MVKVLVNLFKKIGFILWLHGDGKSGLPNLIME